MSSLQAPDDDGLFIPTVGPWSADKHHFLRRYLDAFTTAMKDKNWSGLHFVDLFAGAGFERLRGDGLDWGSPLIATQIRFGFDRIHCCEKRKLSFDALEKRITRFKHEQQPQMLRGDCNTLVNEVVRQLPQGSLSTAFLDPYGLHLHFETLKRLAERRTDWIIFFPDRLDALRNWRQVYAGQPDSNLDRVLGTTEWYEALMASPRDAWAKVLREIYESQIRSLGYKYIDYERIYFQQGKPLYLLIFCSRDEAGGTIWRRIATKKPSGQTGFDW